MTDFIRQPLKKLSAYWFSPMPAERLAAVRCCVGFFALWYFGRRIGLYSEVARGQATHFDPVGLAGFLNAPMAPIIIDLLFALMLLLIVFFIVGWRYRITAPLLALLSLFLISYRNSWSMIYHTDNAMWLQLFILSMAPAADRLSWDSFLLRRRTQLESNDMPATNNLHGDRLFSSNGEVAEQYGWPLRLMALATGITYFLAGIAKVASESGWGWALGEPMRMQVAVDGLRKELFGSQAPDLAFFLYEHIWLFTLAGIGTLILELGAPIFLINRSIGRLWAVVTYGMHVGIWLVMGITFEYCLSGVIFAFLFDLENPVYAIRRWFAQQSQSETDPAPAVT